MGKRGILPMAQDYWYAKNIPELFIFTHILCADFNKYTDPLLFFLPQTHTCIQTVIFL